MFSNTWLVCVIVLFLFDFTRGQSDDYTFIEALNHFYKIHTKPQNWFDAKLKCAQEGASLFYPENDDEQDAVMSFRNTLVMIQNDIAVPYVQFVFVGISDIMTEGVFETIDGKPLSEVYSKWKPNEPNNLNGREDCVEWDNTGKMNDVECSEEFPFICKKNLPKPERNYRCNKDGQKDKEFMRKDYTYIEAVNSFYKIHTTSQNWFEAKLECAQEEANLFYPENDDEQDAVMSFRNTAQPDVKWVFLGISDLTTEGVFETIDGKALSQVYSNWKSNEPNNVNGEEDCVEQDNAGKMNDVKCSQKFPFICKKSLSTPERNNSCNKDGKEEYVRKDYTYIEAVNSFYKIHTTPQNWSDAKLECAQEGASLFYPENDDEQDAVMSFRNSNKPDVKWVFVGISDLLTEGTYETIDGKPLSEVYSNWKSNEPNDANGEEDCVEQDNEGKMNDVKCSQKMSFICKKSLLALQQNNSCNFDYFFDNNNFKCYKLHSTLLTWAEAYMVCRAEQAHLAVITNRSEAEYLAKLTESASKEIIGGNHKLYRGIYHLGFHYRFKEGWQTVRGTPFNVDDDVWWDNNQPIIDENEQCGSMFYTGRLRGVDCDTNSFFICEQELDTSYLPEEMFQ